MKTLVFYFCFLIFTVLILSSCGEKQKQITPAQKDELSKLSADFMKTLKEVLIKEMQTNGALAAVGVCSDTAQSMTKKYADQNALYLKRISLKNRNPNNYPNEFEAKILNLFEEKHKQGQLKPDEDYTEIITIDGKDYIRYLKPIFVQAECLTCHGLEEQIPHEIKTLLDEKYENDKARNYSAGDFRGAVSIRKPIN
jgi:hypothetical protein